MAPAAASASLVVARIDCPVRMIRRGQALAHGQVAPDEDLAVVDVVREAQPLASLVVDGDEHRFGVEDGAHPVADELDDVVELELLRERLADLVDEGQLGVALAGLLHGPDAGQGGRDVAAHEGQDLQVLGLQRRALLVGLDDHDAERPALPAQGHPQPVLAGLAHALDLALGDEHLPGVLGEQTGLAGAQHVGGQPAGIARPERLPGMRIGQVLVDRVDVVREVDGLAVRVVQGDVEVAGIHELADDLVDRAVEVVHVGGRAGRLGDAVERLLEALAVVGRRPAGRVVRTVGGHGQRVYAPTRGSVTVSHAPGSARDPRGGRSSRMSPAPPGPR